MKSRATGRTFLAHVDSTGGVQLYRESLVTPSGWGWTEPGVDSESDTRGACTPSDLGPPEEAALAVMSVAGIHGVHAGVHRRLAKVVLATAKKHTQERENALVGDLGQHLARLLEELKRAVEQHKERAVAVAVENSDPAHPWPLHRARGQAMYQAVIDAYERGEWSPWDELAAALIESTGTKGKALAARVRELAEEDRQYYAEHGTFQDERGPWGTWLSFKSDHPTMCPMAWHLANAVFEDVSMNMERIAISARSNFRGTPMLRMPVDKVSTRIQLAVSGGDPSHREGGGRVEKLDQITGCSITWGDGEEEELQLRLPWDYSGLAPLVAVQRKYGHGALRQLQTALFLDWVSWREAKQSYATWWPEKHLAVQGSSAPTRREMLEYMDLLETATLAVTYAAGRVESAPLVALRNKTRTVAVKGVRQGRLLHAELQVHKALTRGLRRSYWPYPLRMLQVKTRTGGDVYPLAVIAGQMFRKEAFRGKEPNAQPVAKKKGRALLESIGGRWQKGRDVDPRAGARLTRAMDEAVRAGVIGSYSTNGKDPAHHATAWHLTPSDTSMQHAMAGEGLRRLPQLPETGDELAMWLANRRETQRAMAKQLGVSESYLKKAKRLGDLPIGGKLSVQIMRFAWKLDTPEPDQGA